MQRYPSVKLPFDHAIILQASVEEEVFLYKYIEQSSKNKVDFFVFCNASPTFSKNVNSSIILSKNDVLGNSESIDTKNT